MSLILSSSGGCRTTSSFSISIAAAALWTLDAFQRSQLPHRIPDRPRYVSVVLWCRGVDGPITTSPANPSCPGSDSYPRVRMQGHIKQTRCCLREKFTRARSSGTTDAPHIGGVGIYPNDKSPSNTNGGLEYTHTSPLPMPPQPRHQRRAAPTPTPWSMRLDGHGAQSRRPAGHSPLLKHVDAL